MSAPAYPFGLYVPGPTHLPREVVMWDTLFRAAAAAAPPFNPSAEGYLSAFRYDRAICEHMKATGGSAAGFAGPVYAQWLWFDIDRKELDHALADARKLACGLLERYPKFDEDELLVFFSGKKGVHVGLLLAHKPAGHVAFNDTAKRLAIKLARLAGVEIDEGIYDRVRPFRLPNSLHPATKLHKVFLTHEELMGLDAAGVRKLAATPRPFCPRMSAAEEIGELELDWNVEATAVGRVFLEKAARRIEDVAAGGPDRLNRATLDFIANGAGEGDRHRITFSAAANLGEFGCPPKLALALLMPSALDSGLSPGDAARQIECGLMKSLDFDNGVQA